MNTKPHHDIPHRSSERVRTFGCLAACFLLLPRAALIGAEASQPDTADHPFRMGFSSSLFREMNEGDIRVFLRAWTETLSERHGIQADTEPTMFGDPLAMDRALSRGQVDAAVMATVEHFTLSRELQGGRLLLPVINGEVTEEYVLLAHQDGPVQTLRDLSGRSLVVLDNVRACLAPLWLDSVLARHGLPPGEGTFSKVTRTKKLSQAVLPVFFRQAELCLVTRSGFKTASELNPQVGRHLRVLASSPAVVPSLFCYRPDYPPDKLKKILMAATSLHQTPGGQQLQTIFKVDRLEERPPSSLDSARALMAEHQRVCETSGTPAVELSIPAGQAAAP